MILRREERGGTQTMDSHGGVTTRTQRPFGVRKLMETCRRVHKERNQAFLTTAKELLAAQVVHGRRGPPSVAAVVGRITQYNQLCKSMSSSRAIGQLREFGDVGRRPIAPGGHRGRQAACGNGVKLVGQRQPPKLGTAEAPVACRSQYCSVALALVTAGAA